MLYNRLFSTYIDLHVTADEQGSQEFVESLRRYILDKHKPDLFWSSTIDIVSSKSNVLVQLADFFSGTLAKVYEGDSNSALKEEYLNLIKSDRCLGLVEWPTKYPDYSTFLDKTSSDFDSVIYQHALSQAEIFLEENDENIQEEIKLQVCVLGYLVFKSRYDNDAGYVSTQQLIGHLHASGYLDVSTEMFRSVVIAKLRDSGVIIVSCNKGYKIPKSYADCHDFVERVNSLILPLLMRLNKARRSYLMATKNEIDLLKGINYPELVEFLEVINKRG